MRNLVKGVLVFVAALSLASSAMASGKEKAAKKGDKKGKAAGSCYVCKDEPAAEGAEAGAEGEAAACQNKEPVKAKSEEACKKANGVWEAAKK